MRKIANVVKEQLNSLMVKRSLVSGVDEATRRILAREVKVEDEFVTSPNLKVDVLSNIELKPSCDFVSRGGVKLKKAIDSFEIDVKGRSCLDIGSSTGGFSDCLLQEGAGRVACVDVNYGQLAWKIRTDERVDVFERTNIKEARPEAIGAPFDIVVIDVSFIGLAQLARTIASFCYSEEDEKTTQLVALVKPEFEACRSENEGGLVKDENVQMRCIDEVSDALVAQGFVVCGVKRSPIRGKKKGNTEFLLYAKH